MTDVLQLFFYQGNSTLPYPRTVTLTPYVEHMRNLSKVIKPRFSHQKTAFYNQKTAFFISENGVFLTIKCKGIRPLMIHNLFELTEVGLP